MKTIRVKKFIDTQLFNQLSHFANGDYSFHILDAWGQSIYANKKNTLSEKKLTELADKIIETKKEIHQDPIKAAPIIINDTLISILVVKDEQSANPKFADFFALLTNLIFSIFSKEIEKKNLVNEALDKYKEINILYQLSKTLAEAFDLDKALKLILKESINRTKAESGFIFFTEPKAKKIEIKSSVSEKLNTEETLDLLNIFTPWVTQAIDNYITNGLQAEIINEIENDTTIKSLIYYIFKRDTNNFGIIILINKRDNTIFTAQNMNFLSTVASQAAFAISNIDLMKKLIQAEKLSTVGRLTSTIIHDIKNPLFVIKSFAEFLTNPNLDPNKRDTYLKTIISEFDRLLNMTSETLEFTKGEITLDKKEWDFSEIIMSTYELLKHDFEKHKKNLTIDNPLHKRITADADKIKRVFFNIADNAKDALPEGGSLEIHINNDKNTITIEFRDNGKGMPEDVQEKIFEPFFSSGKKRGTGLGMPIVKKIIEAHNGTITFKSTVGQGTTFSIKLPLT